MVACVPIDKVERTFAFTDSDARSVAHEHFSRLECDFYIDSLKDGNKDYSVTMTDKAVIQELYRENYLHIKPVQARSLYKKVRYVNNNQSLLDMYVDSSERNISYINHLGEKKYKSFKGGDSTRYWNFRERIIFYKNNGVKDTVYVGQDCLYPNFDKPSRYFYVIFRKGQYYLKKGR